MGKRGKKSRRKKASQTSRSRDPVSDAALYNYFRILSFMSGETSTFKCNYGSADVDALMAARVHERIREARVYAIAPQTYSDIEGAFQEELSLRYVLPAFQEADGLSRLQQLQMLPSVLSKLLSEPRKELPPSIRKAYDELDGAAKRVELPRVERWPFRSMWIGLGKGVKLTSDASLNRYVWAGLKGMIEEGPENLVTILGYFLFTDTSPLDHHYDETGVEVLSWGPQVVEVMQPELSEHPRATTVYDECQVYNVGSGWDRDGDPSPWLLRTLIELLLESRTSVTAHDPTYLQQKRAERVLGGIPMPIPKPYYVVRVRDRRVAIDHARQVARRRLPGCPWQLRHRFDVSGHERCRIKRGPLPLDDKTRKVLEKRRYRIYTVNAPSPEDAHRLAQRGVPPKAPSEWLAILTSQVSSFKKGPEGAPYVPAIRRAG
jgi:hypothetical protein